ncbi:MAG TPA: C40 family peptidase [Methylophilaceae bacterium]|nr:C40 family peptidase [Methylophilaceae bacterium]
MRYHQQLFIVSLALLSATPAVADPTVIPGNTPAPVQQPASEVSWSSTAQEVLINALSLTGIKYKYGGNSPETGFDCSGFVRYVFRQATDLTLPHGARAISQLGQSVALSDLQPGDLVFFNTLKSTFSHVGIYLGNNRFIHSPSSGGGINVVNMNDKYWAERFNGARRIDKTANVSEQE